MFQAGRSQAMGQLELLWAAAALMLLGAIVSLCVKCQLSGKVLPPSLGWGVMLGRPLPLGMSPLGGLVLLSHALVLGVSSSWGCSQQLQWGRGSAGGQGAAGGWDGPPDPAHPFPGVDATPWAAEPPPWALWSTPHCPDAKLWVGSGRRAGERQARKERLEDV